MSKSDWNRIGTQAGWKKEAQAPEGFATNYIGEDSGRERPTWEEERAMKLEDATRLVGVDHPEFVETYRQLTRHDTQNKVFLKDIHLHLEVLEEEIKDAKMAIEKCQAEITIDGVNAARKALKNVAGYSNTISEMFKSIIYKN